MIAFEAPKLPELPTSAWTKSSYSGAEGNACIETATLTSGVAVRDSKEQNGPTLIVSPAAWSAFVAHTAS